MLTYDLTQSGGVPLYEYICRCIKKDVANGVLKSGEKLPSKRQFAENLGVSVITVENAYLQLVAEGYIYSLPQRGFYVSEVAGFMADKKAAGTVKTPRTKQEKRSYFADFSNSQTPSDLFPFSIWTRTVREVLSDSRFQLMTGSPCKGNFELRDSIARYLREFRGMNVEPEQVVVGAGTEYLYGLLIQLLGSDRIYSVENPGYRKVEKINASFHSKCAWLSMDEAGVRLSDIEKKKVEVLHVTPAHQFPTGIVMPMERRKELLAWVAQKGDRYIIEDDYDSELHLSGRALPTLQSLDAADRVIYMNTFTRTLCSTVRLSYMILPKKLASDFEDRLSFYSCTVSNFEQYTLAQFINSGKFESHVNRLRSFYKKKRDSLLEALAASELGTIAEVSGAEAGLHFLMKLKTLLPEEEVLKNAERLGIRLVPLSRYYSENEKIENVYVMSYATIDTAKADEIMKRIYNCCMA